MWRGYFISNRGEVLITISSWETPEEAALRSKLLLDFPQDEYVLDLDDQQVAATTIDSYHSFTVEEDEPDELD